MAAAPQIAQKMNRRPEHLTSGGVKRSIKE
jgi:hypothetical protein